MRPHRLHQAPKSDLGPSRSAFYNPTVVRMFSFSFLPAAVPSDSHNTDAVSHVDPRLEGKNHPAPTSLRDLKLGSRDISRTESWCGQTYRRGQNRRLVLAGSEVQMANCFALSFPSPLRHTPTNVRLPVSTQRYGREAHPAFAVVVRETLPKLHRTENSMTFYCIFASGFLEADTWSCSAILNRGRKHRRA